MIVEVYKNNYSICRTNVTSLTLIESNYFEMSFNAKSRKYKNCSINI